MLNSSRNSQRGSSDSPIDLLSLISDVDSASIDLIGQQQQAQIDSLKVQVQSLENELTSRNEESLLIKKRISQTSITINQFVQSLLNVVDKEEKEKIDFLKKIKNEINSYNKIDQYITFTHNYTQTNIESFNRVCNQLRNHIKLIELLNSETNSSLLISSQQDYRQILLNEAHKTNEFLKNASKSTSFQNYDVPHITDILDINNFSEESRYEKVQTLIYDYDIPIEELKALLLQEIALTDILRKYILTNFSEQTNGTKFAPNMEDLRNQIEEQIRGEITDQLAEKVRIQTENELRSKIEQELRFKIELEQQQYNERLQIEQKMQEEKHAQTILEIENEIERLKRSAKDDFIKEITNDRNSDLRQRVISLLRGEIENEVRSQIRNENQISPKNNFNQNSNSNSYYESYPNQYQNYQQSLQEIQDQQKQEYESRLQKSIQDIQNQQRQEYEIRLQKSLQDIQNQQKQEYDNQLQKSIRDVQNKQKQEYEIRLQKSLQDIQDQQKQEYENRLQKSIQDVQNKQKQEYENRLQNIQDQQKQEYENRLQKSIMDIQNQQKQMYEIRLQKSLQDIQNQQNQEYETRLQKSMQDIQNQQNQAYEDRLQKSMQDVQNQQKQMYEIRLQKSLQEIQNQKKQEYEERLQQSLQMKEKLLRSQLELELQQKEVQIRKQLESQIRGEIQSKISIDSQPKSNRKYFNYSSEKIDNFNDQSSSYNNQINDRYLDDVYNTLCNACGVTPTTVLNYRKSENGDYHSNPLLVSILDHASSLASDVYKLRLHVIGNKKGRYNFLSRFEELEAQVAHLDQLHTHTRALLIKQSQIISDLRVKAGSESWIRWARNLFNILNPDNNSEEEEVNFTFTTKSGIINIMDPQYADGLRQAIEEKAVALIANEKKMMNFRF